MVKNINWYYLVSKIIKKLHIPAVKNSDIDRKSRICSGSHVINTKLGRYSYIGNFCTVINVQIGSFCSIADNCIIGGASHPIEWVSTSPVFHRGKNIMKTNFSLNEYETGKQTIIKNDVWIGNNCLIKSGITIGNGAIVEMGSVLTKNVGEYEIWAGNPAKLIRKRFSENKNKELTQCNCWNWDEDLLYRYAPDFNNVDKFLEYKHKENRK